MSSFHCVGIIGCGTMGRQIAKLLVESKLNVVIFDEDIAVASQLCTQLQLSDKAKNSIVTTADSLADFRDCELIIESVIEDVRVKAALFESLEQSLPTNNITFATNTSTIQIADIGSKLQNPKRLVGTHFFHPIAKRNLVEIVKSELADQTSVNSAVRLCQQLGKRPIIVKDTPGFVVNRLLFPYSAEALQLLQEGHSISEIDSAAREHGMPWGPFQLTDAIGLDTAFLSGRSIFFKLGDRVALSPILPKLVKKKQLGKKTGEGFYRYDDAGCEISESPKAVEIIAKYIGENSHAEHSLIERLLLPVLTEASIAIADGIVDSTDEIDAALIEGLHFPKAPAGIFGWAESLGVDPVIKRLEQLSPIGKRYHATQWLIEKSKSGRLLDYID